ncbi:MAG: hypothetical protein HQ556_03205 [Candidatus Marinimicrobia bacterium]|nr:hypothetical protein [Candidatus Neomarinimicrobiota bacterium]
MRYLAPILLLILLVACPKPPEETICGQGMQLSSDTCACVPNSHPVEDGESCECDTSYHWNVDGTECILDTTSHIFTLEFDTLGIYGSYLNDVSILAENDIWVVGYIATDSSIYNVAHWDGVGWEMMQILRPVDFEGVFALSQNDIWFVDGCKIFHYNGQQFTEMWMCDWAQYGINQVTTIWGNSSSNIYFVGNHGSVVHCKSSKHFGT